MSRPDDMSRAHPDMQAQPFVHDGSHSRYLVLRREDVWFIEFNGDEYGPYRTEREALLFAIEAAYKLGEQGEKTQVLRLQENGAAQPVWTRGDAYPPRE